MYTLPWVEEIKLRYTSSESSIFVLHGNIRDLYPWMTEDGELLFLDIQQFLKHFLERTKDYVLYYNLSDGLRLEKGPKDGLVNKVNKSRLQKKKSKFADLPRPPHKVLEFIEEILVEKTSNAGVILDYVEMLLPSGALSFMSDGEKSNLIQIHRWTSNIDILTGDSIVFLLAESLSDIPKRLLACPQLSVLEIERPRFDERLVFVQKFGLQEVPFADEITPKRFAEVCAGLSLVQIRSLLRRARETKTSITFSMVNTRKKSIIEQECHGLVEFVAPKHDFSHVGGMKELKDELHLIAKSIRLGHKAIVPMGMLFVGPMGTGKTFVAEAFAGESGLTCIKFKNFRDKWVGSTEGNLEKILQVVRSLGYVLLIIDEADRSMSGQDGDGGTSSRVIAKIKEFMSETSNRGRIVILMMTNRPDKIDIDLKRPGRLDVKIPFFFPQDQETRIAVTKALIRKNKLDISTSVDIDAFAQTLEGYSGAEIESVLLRAMRESFEEYYRDSDDKMEEQLIGEEEKIKVIKNPTLIPDQHIIQQNHLIDASKNTIPSRDQRMLKFMELLAVFESSSRDMLPEKYQAISNEEVVQELDQLRKILTYEKRA
jgi:transitional endoplasmic reticulum ATPase